MKVEQPIPFSLSPPRVRSTWAGFIGFLLSVQRAEDRCGYEIQNFYPHSSDLLSASESFFCKAPDNTSS